MSTTNMIKYADGTTITDKEAAEALAETLARHGLDGVSRPLRAAIAAGNIASGVREASSQIRRVECGRETPSAVWTALGTASAASGVPYFIPAYR